LSEDLVKEMQDAFMRSEELLDLKSSGKVLQQKQNNDLQSAIANANPETLKEILQLLTNAINSKNSIK
jgi:hypothetical protein